MKSFFQFVIALLVSASLMGCGTNGAAHGGINGNNENGKGDLAGKKPPTMNIEIDGEKYETKKGSYCWNDKCVDTSGPTELLKGEKPIQVQAGKPINMVMNFTPKPGEIHLTQINHDKKTEVKIHDNQFVAPHQEGTYLYDYGVEWLDKKDKTVSHGDASYVFALDVK